MICITSSFGIGIDVGIVVFSSIVNVNVCSIVDVCGLIFVVTRTKKHKLHLLAVMHYKMCAHQSSSVVYVIIYWTGMHLQFYIGIYV